MPLIDDNFYPRPPRGGRLDGWTAGLLTKDISIHALREEGARGALTRPVNFLRFLSTPSARRATYQASDTSALSKFLSTPSARRAT